MLDEKRSPRRKLLIDPQKLKSKNEENYWLCLVLFDTNSPVISSGWTETYDAE